DDGIVSRLKFVRIGEDYEEYGLPIPDMMLNDKIKQSGSYQIFIKYSTKQEVVDTTQALKESKKTSKRQPGTEGSSKGTSRIPGVPDESTIASEANIILEWGSEQESEYLEEDQRNDKEVDWIYSDEDDEKKDDADDDKSIDLEMTDGEEIDIKFVHGDEQVNDDEDEKMLNAEVEDSGKGDAKISDMVKADAKKNEEINDDAKKAELPLTSSNLSISSASEPIPTPQISTDAPTITTIVSESDALSTVQLRVTKLEKDVFELKKINHSAEAFATFKSQVPIVFDNSFGSKLGDALQKSLHIHSVQPAPESSKIQTSTINLEQESEKSALEICKIKREQAEKKKMPKYMDENAMDKGVSDTIKNHKRKNDNDDDDDDEDTSAGPNQGKKTKRRRTKETESSKKPC
ncbi:hypothetical protein Tco_0902981, partial [Tanacetum coccineum]